MAILTQTATKLVSYNTKVILVAAGTIDASAGAQFTPVKSDKQTLYMIYGGSSGGTITVAHGNGQQGVEDLAIVIGAGATYLIQLESGLYKNSFGASKGKILMTSSVADSTLSVFELV